MSAQIPGYADARQAAERLDVTAQHVYNLNSSRTDFPAPIYVGRTPLWPVDRLDAWRQAHPKPGKR
ncbi:DNA-binding protein [Streptomyces sp. F001]|uniref:helix-turn-helix transcriptional regulator n=1 Tax=Streptomyces sp. F001 TaxID=1510026 RepID=UPI00101E5DE8|nr:DNA-binding protein [Streptomyces sp. F001]RZB15714.1 DNA-binding protein [Streptomyces sp. F001]